MPVAPWAIHAGVAFLLLTFVLALYARLLFTNRGSASGDILYYFTPYRDYAAAALRSGRIPLWNPYTFLGVPFLANPQAAVLYPLHWPLAWLPVSTQIYWSAALHTWILGLGGYALLRRWGSSPWAGLVAALVLAGSGFYGGLVGHINQMNGAAWLPWSIWALEAAGRKRRPPISPTGRDDSLSSWQPALLSAAFLALFTMLMLLAGHIQTVYINLFGVGVWSLFSPYWRHPRRQWHALWNDIRPRLLTFVVGVAVGALLAGAQLLPTFELSAQGLRSGGLGYLEASSFSLKPLRLPWTLLPSYGLTDLSVLFETLGYTEFMAYVGIVGFLLALWARGVRGRARWFGLFFVAIGFLLAMGRWNPLYYALYKIVPGFDLFRAPARWMMLYTLGMAVLAGLGMDALLDRLSSATDLRLRRLLPVLVCLLLALELVIAARALPHTQPTAPQAIYGLRSAPAHLLSDPLRSDLDPAAAGRFLSMSTITFDPGDMPDYRRIFLESDPPQLDSRAFEQLVIAQKGQEILAPNLPLLWRVPAVDGFDGGVLPLQRYNRLLTLFIPAEDLVPDGRLREQVTDIPHADLLGLLNVQYVITDKVKDLWFDDIYYDRQIGARLTHAQPSLEIEIPYSFEATHLSLIGYVEDEPTHPYFGDGINKAVVTVELGGVDGSEQLALIAGREPGAHFADPTLDSGLGLSAAARVAYRDVDAGRQEYLAHLPFDALQSPISLALSHVAGAPDVVIQAATLVDERSGMFLPLLPSDRGRFRQVHSGDVKIYENLDTRPRVEMVRQWVTAVDGDDALQKLQEGDFDLTQSAVVEGLDAGGSPDADARAELVVYGPERLIVNTSADADSLLLVRDTGFPGWQAEVDGVPTPIYNANYLFRAIPISAGEHQVVFEYRPLSWRYGLVLSAIGLAAWLLLMMGSLWLLFRQRDASDV